MVTIYDKNGIVVLDSEFYQLKIDNNRKVYVKKPSQKEFTSIGEEVPLGLSIEDKKRYLHTLYQKIEAKRMETQSEQKV